MGNVKAEVVAVFPNKVKIVVDDLENFRIAEESLRVGSYLKISDNENAVLVAIIENFQIQAIGGFQGHGGLTTAGRGL